MGDGYIPWNIIHQYAATFGLDDDETEDLHYFVFRLDNAYLEWKKDHSGT